jgi:phage-related protein
MNWPLASDRLFFKADDSDQKSETVIREGRSYEAYKCGGCGAVLVTTQKWGPA